MDISVDVRSKELEAQLSQIAKQFRSRVLITALNQTGRKGRTETTKWVAGELNAKSRYLKEHRFYFKPANAQTLTVTVGADGKKLLFNAFKGLRQTKKGITVKIFKKSIRYGRSNPRPFVVKSSKLAFVRKSRHRKPLKVLRGPSVADVWDDKEAQAILDRVIAEELPKNVERGIRGVIYRSKGR